LSLNPLVHLDIFGTIMLLLACFGWGKPVPVNLYNLKWKRFGGLAVSLAGPIANILSVILFIIIFNLIAPLFPMENMLLTFLLYLVIINIILGVFNLIPIPPLDGSKVLFTLLPARFDVFKQKFAVNGPWLLVLLLIADNFLGFNIFGRIFSFFIDLIEFFI